MKEIALSGTYIRVKRYFPNAFIQSLKSFLQEHLYPYFQNLFNKFNALW